MRSRPFIFFLIVACVLLFGCSGSIGPSKSNASSDGSLADESNDLGGPSERLIVYSGRSESLVQPLIDRFSASTGIDVQVRYGGTAELAATLLEEGDRSPSDIFFAQDPGGLGAIESAGLLAPLPETLVAKVPDRFASPSNLWLGVSGRARVIVYNTDLLTTEDLPADMWGFADPEWHGRIGWAPSNGSFQAMVTGMRKLWGEELTRDWLKGISANEPIVYEKNTPIVAAVGAGEVDVGFVNHYYLYRFIEEEGEGFPARNYFLPDGGPGSLMMVSGAGMLKTAPNKQNALRFLEFLLSAEAQQYFTTETYEYPVRADIAVSPLLPALSELDAVAANISLADLADLEGTVKMLSDLGILP